MDVKISLVQTPDTTQKDKLNVRTSIGANSYKLTFIVSYRVDAGYYTEDIIPASKGSTILLILNSSQFKGITVSPRFSPRGLIVNFEI